MDPSSLIEGHCKFRDGKKWKSRWATVTKLSPVADCLQLQIYRDEKEKVRHGHTKASLSLQNFLAMESGFTLDKESQTLAIICQDLSVVLAFENRERLIQWSVRIANNLGETTQYLAQLAVLPPKSKLSPGPVKLHVTEGRFCLTGGLPPKLLGSWDIPQLRRYGIVDGKLVFEGGSRCGRGEGLHVLLPDPQQTQNIIETLDSAAKGQLNRNSSKKFTHGTDSPRKSIMNKFGETRPGAIVFGGTGQKSPMPRENASSEDLNSPPKNSTQWVSSDSCSSRSEFDVDGGCGCDSISSHPLSCSSPIGQPQPSAMERCLSCMSKLGQGGCHGPSTQDFLKPSWTMDLSLNAGMETGFSADRISLSSHGSSGCGGAEFPYDTPRGALLKQQRTGSQTPPIYHTSTHAHDSPGRIQGRQDTCGWSSPPLLVHTHCPHACVGNPIYYTPDQTSAQVQKLKHSYGGPGPYENYDFPRSSAQVPGCCSNGTCTSQIPYGIDWSKKLAMDRHSIASTAMCTEGLGGWYDTPRKSAEVYCSSRRDHCGCNSCACAHHFHTHPVVQGRDPMENYDFPAPERSVCQLRELQPMGGVGASVNGEGKMPLVTGSAQIKIPSHAIYAQVDKSKKTPRPLPTCDESSTKITGEPQSQPLYVNSGQEGQIMSTGVISQGQAPKTITSPINKQSNYVNLEFVESLELYENSKGGLRIVPEKSDSTTEVSREDPIEKNLNEKKVEHEALDGEASLPLRRSSSVPCKGGHANRGSASSSDSGVSGDGGLFFEDASPLNELGSLCLHESLPRKGQRTSMGGKSPGSNYSPKVPETPNEPATEENYTEIEEEEPLNVSTSPRHYETIPEVDISKNNGQMRRGLSHVDKGVGSQRVFPDGHSNRSTSSGASDMSDYLETLSSSSRGSHGTLPTNHKILDTISTENGGGKTRMKPRSGKEYFKIDRSLFTQID